MRLNKYLFFKEFTNEVVCVNLINRNIFCLSKDNYDYLIKNVNMIDDNDNSPLITAMIKLGIIVKNDCDDFLKLNFMHRKDIFSDLNYRLTINPTLDCNLGCWYCYETHIQGIMKQEIAERIFKFVRNKFNNREINFLTLDWFGGEPLLAFNNVIYPLSKMILDEAEKQSIYITNSITTNGSLITDEMIEKFEEVKLNNFQITIDGNKDKHDSIRKYKSTNRGTFTKIIDNIHKISVRLKNPKILLRFNYTKNNLDSFKDIVEFINPNIRSKIEVCFQQVWQEKSFIEVVDLNDYKMFFKNQGFLVDLEGLNLKGYTCYADKKNQSVINLDGNVFKCTARDFRNTKPDGFLNANGDIEWDDSLLACRLGKANYENIMCQECSFIPVCWGPCSQKQIEQKSIDGLSKYCLKEGVLLELNNIANQYHKKVMNLL